MRLINLLLSIMVLSLFAACASTQGPLATEMPKPKIALVLGGGAARGFAHVGVIRVLEQEKNPDRHDRGNERGSLIGAIYASDMNSFDLEWTAFALEKTISLIMLFFPRLPAWGP